MADVYRNNLAAVKILVRNRRNSEMLGFRYDEAVKIELYRNPQGVDRIDSRGGAR
jgi:hypothetical protein